MRINLRSNLVMNYGTGEWRTPWIRIFVNQSLVQQEWNPWLGRNTSSTLSVHHAWLEKLRSKTFHHWKGKWYHYCIKATWTHFHNWSVEGYLHAVVLVDNQTGYWWIYDTKTKAETIKVVKQWYSYIAYLCARHKLVVVMLDNAG